MLWEAEVKNEQSGNKCMPGIWRGRKNYDIKKVVKKKFLNELNKLDTKWHTKYRIYKFCIPAKNCIYSFIKINVKGLW